MTAVPIVAPARPRARARAAARPARPAADLLIDARALERAGCIPEAVASYEAAIRAAGGATGDRAVLAEALRRLAVVQHRGSHSGEARRLAHRSFTAAPRAGTDVPAAAARGGGPLLHAELRDRRAHRRHVSGRAVPPQLRRRLLPARALRGGTAERGGGAGAARAHWRRRGQGAGVPHPRHGGPGDRP